MGQLGPSASKNQKTLQWLSSIAAIIARFAQCTSQNSRGVNLLVTSSDPKDRAEKAQAEWDIEGLPLSYGLSVEDARKVGLYISASIGTTSTGVVEPDLFAEPALLLIKPDQTLYFADIQTMPFLRPDLSGLLANLDFIVSKGYPARGEA